MKQIFNWTVGSFFRTIGRTIAVLMLGGLFYYILSSNGFDFGIKDLFFESVKADTYQQLGYSNWANQSGTLLTCQANYCYQSYTNTQDGNYALYYYFNQDKSNITISEGTDYFEANVNIDMIFNGGNSSSTSTTGSHTCYIHYNAQSSGTLYTDFQCGSVNYDTTTWNQQASYSVMPTIFYGDDSNSNCYFKDYDSNSGMAKIHCNILPNRISRGLKYIRIWVNVYGFNDSVSNNFIWRLGISKPWYFMSSDSQTLIEQQQQTNQEIQNQTQQQQQQHQEIMDNNTTQAESDAEGFFGNFTTPDVGGLSAIITAPLNTIRSLLNSQCTNLVLPLPFVDEDITLPCMNEIYTQHFGAFFTIYQTIVLALIAYRCIRSIFFDIHGFTNPDDDRIEVMDL